MPRTDPMPSDDVISLPIPSDLAAHFITEEAKSVASKRELFPLKLGDTDLGMWRIENIKTEYNGAYNHIVATLRRCWP